MALIQVVCMRGITHRNIIKRNQAWMKCTGKSLVVIYRYNTKKALTVVPLRHSS